jgi:hypothetical protein
MKKTYIITILALSFVFSTNSYADEQEKTDLYFTGGLFASANIYIADFSAFPEIPNNSPGFDTGFGFTPGFNVGIEKKLKKSLWGMPMRYSGNLRVTLLSGKFKKDEFIGYDLEDNSHSKLYSNHELTATLPTAMIENSLIFKVNNLPLSFKVGANIGTTLGATFEQSEKLGKDERYFENGKGVQNEYDGDIPDANPIYLGLTTGVRYESITAGPVELIPELAFNYSLLNVSSAVDWKSHNITLGVTAAYNKPKALPPVEAPIEPVTPELPMPIAPAAPKELDFALTAFANNMRLSEKAEVILDVVETYKYDEFHLPNTLYYNKNEVTSYIFAADSIVKNAVLKMQREPNIKLNIVAFSPKFDAENIIKERTKILKNTFIRLNIDSDRISITEKVVNKKYKYPELIDEDRRIELRFSDREDVVVCKMVRDINLNTKKISLKIKPEIKAEAGIKSFTGTVYSDIKGGTFADFNEKGAELFIDKSFMKQSGEKTQVKILADITDNENKTQKAELQFAVISNKIEKYESIKHNQFQSLAIGYCHFDKSRFYAINEEAVKLAKSAIKNGKKVRLIAMTDYLGEDDYNNKLVKRRMKTALRTIGVKKDSENIELIYRSKQKSNTAFDRTLSRAVYVEIER